MADMMAGPIQASESPAVETATEAPLFRTVGYCASCGTWDEHGPVCVSCGYDFTGEDGATTAL